MNDSAESALSSSFSDLASAIPDLDAHLRRIKVTNEEILFQLAVIDFASQVLEAAKATLLLQLSAVPRANWATARLAFEAMHDLFYLLELCPERQEAGARIYVGALSAKAKSRGKLDLAADVAEIDDDGTDTDGPGLREFVRSEAEQIEKIDPGARDAILVALDARLKGGERHWSGLQRRQMTKRIRGRTR